MYEFLPAECQQARGQDGDVPAGNRDHVIRARVAHDVLVRGRETSPIADEDSDHDGGRWWTARANGGAHRLTHVVADRRGGFVDPRAEAQDLYQRRTLRRSRQSTPRLARERR